jgi:hypothetical protein
VMKDNDIRKHKHETQFVVFAFASFSNEDSFSLVDRKQLFEVSVLTLKLFLCFFN